jgi:hypothetical protein
VNKQSLVQIIVALLVVLGLVVVAQAAWITPLP